MNEYDKHWFKNNIHFLYMNRFERELLYRRYEQYMNKLFIDEIIKSDQRYKKANPFSEIHYKSTKKYIEKLFKELRVKK